MKTLVVYDSVYGNTEVIARAIASALPGEVQVAHIDQVSADDCEAVDLLLIGSPTQGALPTEAARALIERIGPPARAAARAATFDTRLTWPFLERWGGFAAEKMAAAIEEKGWTMAGTPGGFFVKGLKKGPLRRGEADRAAAWARVLMVR
ncbi:MAG TPA: flavodoxin family protein [Anaerolineae bacterium]|nr:flavodoxin family protein [Anaerolineae bacterium]